MKIISKVLLPFFILLISVCTKAQETENVEKLIVNDWSLKSYEVDGEIFPPKDSNKNDRMIFNSDKTVESISSDKVQKGTWSYDRESRVIKVVDQNNKFEMQLTLISIIDTECVLQLENPENNIVRLNMIRTVQ